MPKSQPHSPGYLRHLHEVALSLNLALVVVWVKSDTTRDWRLLYRVKGFFPPHQPGSDNYAAGLPAFLFLALLLALFFFFLLWLFARSNFVEQFLSSTAGIVALLAVPAGWFCVDSVLGFSRFEVTAAWFPIEATLVITSIWLYIHRKWPIPEWGNILIVIAHFTLWWWVLRLHFLGNTLGSIFPAVGLFSSLLWGFYVSRQSSNMQAFRR